MGAVNIVLFIALERWAEDSRNRVAEAELIEMIEMGKRLDDHVGDGNAIVHEVDEPDETVAEHLLHEIQFFLVSCWEYLLLHERTRYAVYLFAVQCIGLIFTMSVSTCARPQTL